MNKLNNNSVKIPELIMGVKNPAALSVCKDHADAVYFSLDKFSLRARANDITLENLNTFVEHVHGFGLRANLAVNSVIYPDDIPSVDEVIESASSAGIDAIIAWDPAVITRAVDNGLRVHISTQANVSNADTANFYKSAGASRVVLSRELTLEQIKAIRQDTDIELEVFVHGAMCQAISGRCYLSSYLLGKSGNCGECSQPCRWEWTLHADDGREIDLKGKYLLSARDLCMIEHVPELIEAGVDAFKVEGRLRNPSYTATISRCYHEALDDCRNNSYTLEHARELKEQMALEYNRGFSTGFYFGTPGPEGLAYEHNMNVSPVKRQAVGVVTNYYPKQNAAAVKLLEQGLSVGDNIVIEGYTTYLEQDVRSLIVDGESAKEAGQGQEVGLGVDKVVRENDRVYKVERV